MRLYLFWPWVWRMIDKGAGKVSECSQGVEREQKQADQDRIRRLLLYYCFATTWTLTLS